ncbi:DUF1638 domain-containing protein [Haloferula sp. A504]|uniref:DUF1638 domain-containing protein n=1 Tax=Haloferula sp. A504 TaxID=3373601 RepID=UPI0031C308A5|nr:DUF1638 domain-containing protein [Verrucomicrobiaceae bacterium E54]
MDAPPAALIACEVFRDEIDMLAGKARHLRVTRFLEIGLHDQPDRMRVTLQQAIDAMDGRDDIAAIILAYGLCGLGTAGLQAGRHPLVIPRAHDCITVFLGSKESYAERQRACPGCYHYTPGWNRARRVPGPDRLAMMREELSKQFEAEDVDFLIESEEATWATYDTATFIDLGTPNAGREADYTRRCAESMGWRFEHLKGDPALLRDLLHGPWDDERFQTIRPGELLGHSPDEAVMRADPASEK